jgi:hypothetical protein
LIDISAGKRAMDFTSADQSNRFGKGRAVAARCRRRDLLQLIVAYGLILLAIWTPSPEQRLVSLIALVWVLLATWISFDSWTAMGLSRIGFWRSLWVVGAALLIAAAASILASRLQTLHRPTSPVLFVQRYGGYMIWAFLQEFFLLGFFVLRFGRLLPSRRATVMLTMILFSVAHLPNPILTVLTLFWGWASCRLFLQYRNVYTLAMAHAILGICIAVTVPAAVDHNMRVGLGYLTYRPHRILSEAK